MVNKIDTTQISEELAMRRQTSLDRIEFRLSRPLTCDEERQHSIVTTLIKMFAGASHNTDSPLLTVWMRPGDDDVTVAEAVNKLLKSSGLGVVVLATEGHFTTEG